MRVLAALIFMVGAVLVTGCGEESGKSAPAEPSEESSSAKKAASDERAKTAREEGRVPSGALPSNEEPDKAGKKAAEAPASINLSGNGQTATDPFELEGGLVITRMRYGGESNFIVDVLNGNGGRGNIANVIGSFEGSKAENAPAGEYLLDVQASGPWTISIEQPRPADTPETTSFNGAGKTATDFFRLSKGLSKFELTHQGGSNFIVDLLDENGASVGMTLVNEIGPFEGSKAVQVPKDGVYLLQVEAGGPWAIRVE